MPAKRTATTTSATTSSPAVRQPKSVPAPKPNGHKLAHLIPKEELGKKYIVRDLPGRGQNTDLHMFKWAKESQKHVLISGPTGPGKTTAVIAYCALEKLPLATIKCNGGFDASQVVGHHVFDENGVPKFVTGDFIDVVRYGGVGMFDELNFNPPKASAIFHGLLDDRREITLLDTGETIQAHEDFQVIATYNPKYKGTKPLNEALANRFAVKLHYDYDPTIESGLLHLSSLLEMAGQLRDAYKNRVVSTPCSTNMLVEFEDLAWDVGLDFAIYNMLNAFDDGERRAVSNIVDIHLGEIQKDLRELLVQEGENPDDL